MNLGFENETTEFKQTTSEIEEALKDMCAILNKHKQGILCFGVLNNGDVVGQMVG
ncbi:MAG: ATP-binding protein, partial [Acholeplasmatales bacterium]|nr:ATP-binding protein [Acholeplasmatales bacterium]